MDLLAVPVLLCVLWKMEYSGKGFREDELSLENTKAVRGILAVLVVLHHLYQRVGHGVLFFFFDNAGTLCVALFFFLSGYGLERSRAHKPGYRDAILHRRIPSVLVPYLFLTLLYWLFSFLGDSFLTPAAVLRSFFSGFPIAAHSWYILCILVFYFGFYLSVLLWNSNRLGILGTNVLVSLLWVCLCRGRSFPPYWYNAALLFPTGLFWAAYERQIRPFLRRHYGLALAVSLLGFCAFFTAALYTAGEDVLISLYWPGCCCFVVLVLLILMKFRFCNPILLFLGEISFELYGIHGLFERLYRSPAVHVRSDLLWGAAVLASSIAAAWALHRFFRWLLGKCLR